MSITSLFNSVLSTYSGTRTLFADRMAAQRANGAASQQETEDTKDITASNNIDQYLADKSKAEKISAVEESSSSRSFEAKKGNSGTSADSKDASKPQSASGDVLELSEESQQGGESQSSSPIGLNEELSEEEKQQVAELKARDAEVRAHEAAHIAAAGQYAQGGASYTYQTGPDGKKYAIGGEVSIDAGPVSGDPEATIQKAQQVRAAALAPANPSSQDQKVAAAASRMMSQAQVELMQERMAETSGNAESSEQGTSSDVAANGNTVGNMQSSANMNSDESKNSESENGTKSALDNSGLAKPSELAENSTETAKNNNSASGNKGSSATESALSSSALTSGASSSSKLNAPSDQYRLQSNHYAASTFQGGFQAIG